MVTGGAAVGLLVGDDPLEHLADPVDDVVLERALEHGDARAVGQGPSDLGVHGAPGVVVDHRVAQGRGVVDEHPLGDASACG